MAARSEPDFFSFLGLPRKLRIDMTDLEQRYRALSRQFHPDYFYNASAAERRASLERSSYLNDAYRTLKDRVARIEYLLKIEQPAAGSPQSPVGDAQGDPERIVEGSAVGRRQAPKVPAGLLEEVFALNEELDEIRGMKAGGTPAEEWGARLERARKPIEEKKRDHESQIEELSERWDALADGETAAAERREVLAALRERMLERNYIANLLSAIERELNS